MKKRNQIRKITLVTAAMLVLGGCGAAVETDNTSAESTDKAVEADTAESAGTSTTEGIDVNLVGDYSEKAIAAAWSLEESTVVTLEESNIIIEGTGATEAEGVLTIDAAGTYVISGSLTKGQIVVDTTEEDNVQLVLNGVSLENSETAPIYVASAKNVYLTLAEGTINQIVDSRVAAVKETTDETDLSAAIYSKSDLFVNGSGTLTVTGGYKDGITSKDDLKIVDGTISVTASDDGLVGKDSVCVRTGNLTLETGGDGIKSTNTEDTSKGNVIIDGGTLQISAGSDGVESVHVLVINAGNITVSQSEEGLESLNIVINDGVVDVTSSDDGINISDSTVTADAATGEMPADENPGTDPTGEAPTGEMPTDKTAHAGGMGGKTRPDDAYAGGGKMGGGGADFAAIDGALLINGGTITVQAQGDGLDSNGDIQINAGNIIVYGPTNSGNGALDYNGVCEINGGVFFLTGSVGMEQSVSDTSAQKMIAVNLEQAVEAGSEITFSDGGGNVLYSFTTEKACQYLALCAPECVTGESIIYTVGSQTGNVTVQ